MTSAAKALPAVLAHIDADLDNSLNRLFDLVRIPSISTDSAFKDSCKAAADFVAKDLESLGFDATVRPTAGHPVVTATSNGATAPNNGPRVLFYGHYDVQPVDPLNLWSTPPFEPKVGSLPDGRKIILGRGACDDKGQFMTFVEACRAFKAVTGKLPLDITMMIEGEEECGSKSLFDFVRTNANEFKRDLALICDTGMWDTKTPLVTTSLRGLLYEEVTITCADRDLHSGLFGGAAANPIRILSRVLASLHDANGRVTVPGYYDGVKDLPADIKAELKGLNLTAEQFLGQVGLKVPAGEKDRMLIEQISTRPTCDVNGIIGGYTGEGAKTVIAAHATAKVSFRLVGDQNPETVRAVFRAFVRERLPADCTAEFTPHAGSPALNVKFDTPWLARARRALADEWQKEPVLVGGGGSIPVMGDVRDILGLEPLMIGFALEDDRIHSPNEKYDLSSFHGGIRSWARILAAFAKA